MNSEQLIEDEINPLIAQLVQFVVDKKITSADLNFMIKIKISQASANLPKTEVLINECFGGFSISEELAEFASKKNPQLFQPDDIFPGSYEQRMALPAIIREMGKEILSKECSLECLKVIQNSLDGKKWYNLLVSVEENENVDDSDSDKMKIIKWIQDQKMDKDGDLINNRIKQFCKIDVKNFLCEKEFLTFLFLMDHQDLLQNNKEKIEFEFAERFWLAREYDFSRNALTIKKIPALHSWKIEENDGFESIKIL